MRLSAAACLSVLVFGLAVSARADSGWRGIPGERLVTSRVGAPTGDPKKCCIKPALSACDPQPCVTNPLCPLGTVMDDSCAGAKCNDVDDVYSKCSTPASMYNYAGKRCTYTGNAIEGTGAGACPAG